MLRRIGFLVWKELIELTQDPRLLAIVIVAPVLQLLMLGYAATTDIRNVPVIVADEDRTEASRALISRVAASHTFTLAGVISSGAKIDTYLERGDASVAIVIPTGFSKDSARGTGASVQLVADGSDANSAGVSLGYVTNLRASYAAELASARGSATGAAVATAGALEPRVRVWFNPRLESRDFMVPGIIALLLLVVTTNLAAMAIVREREVGTLEQLNVTPLGRTDLIVGKLLPYGLVGLIDVVIVLAVSRFWFEIPLRGSVTLLFGTTAIYLICTLALGLFVSTISETQQQAMTTTTFFFLMPMVLLSGFVFPIENMPDWVQVITYVIPLRYFLVILRAIFLKGVGLNVLWPQVAALLTWGLVVLSLAVARSTKRAA
ncbi:MAG: ABC transporter permease [Acidobacteriaceae bacterium]|nr:ABC transporter permease [Acidobacteriaceae bacterium]